MLPSNFGSSLPPLTKVGSSPALDKLKGGTHYLSSCAGQEDMTFKPLGMSLIDIPPIDNSIFEKMVLSYDEVSQISVYQLRMTCESCLNILELLNSTLGDCTNLVTGLLSVNKLNQGKYRCNLIIEGGGAVLQDFAITLSGSPQVSKIEHKAMTTGSSRFYDDFTLHLPHEEMVDAWGEGGVKSRSPTPPTLSLIPPQNSPMSSGSFGSGGGLRSPTGGVSRQQRNSSPLSNFKKLKTIQANANK